MTFHIKLEHLSMVSLSNSGAPERCFPWVGSRITCRLEKLARDKRSSLMWKVETFGRKKFYNIGHWCQSYKTLFSSITLRKNKLQSLPVLPSLILAGRPETYLQVLHFSRLPIALANIRLDWTWFHSTNTQAVAWKGSFMTSAPGVHLKEVAEFDDGEGGRLLVDLWLVEAVAVHVDHLAQFQYFLLN
jgi:hypothetical protein